MQLEGFTNASDVLRSGVYALCAKGVVIYVGKSKAMLARINSHRSIWAAKRKGRTVPDWLPIPGLLFDEVHIQPCRLDQIDRLEREMIDRYKPRYNVQLKSSQKSRAPVSLVLNGIALQLNASAQAQTQVLRR